MMFALWANDVAKLMMYLLRKYVGGMLTHGIII